MDLIISGSPEDSTMPVMTMPSSSTTRVPSKPCEMLLDGCEMFSTRVSSDCCLA